MKNEMALNAMVHGQVIEPDMSEVLEMTALCLDLYGEPRVIAADLITRFSNNTIRVVMQQHGLYVWSGSPALPATASPPRSSVFHCARHRRKGAGQDCSDRKGLT